MAYPRIVEPFCGIPIAQKDTHLLGIHRQTGELDTSAAIGIIPIEQRAIPPQIGEVLLEDSQTGPGVVLAILEAFLLLLKGQRRRVSKPLA